MLTLTTLAAVMVTACVNTGPEPRCWREAAIYSTSLAPKTAPMPAPSPWGR